MLRPRKKLDNFFKGRDSYTPEEFYEFFFKNDGFEKEIVIGIREIFETHLGYDFSKLRSDDDFSKELKMIWDIDSMADVEIVMSLEEKFHIEISEADSRELTSFREIALLVKRKIEYNKNTGEEF